MSHVGKKEMEITSVLFLARLELPPEVVWHQGNHRGRGREDLWTPEVTAPKGLLDREAEVKGNRKFQRGQRDI